MRHPFDGIIIPESSPVSAGESRRSALRWLTATWASLAALTGLGLRAAAAPPQGNDPDPGGALDAKSKRAKGYRLFFVVPRDIRRFNTVRRKQLGVNGKFEKGWKGRPELAEAPGFTAWLTPAEAAGLGAEADVGAVHELAGRDKVILGRPPAGPGEVIVTLSPNAWREKPDRGTYLTADELADAWSKEFARFGNVKVTPGRTGRTVHLVVSSRSMPAEVAAAVAADPQVSHLLYNSGFTTLRFGEEGGQPPATTRAGAEEGVVSTRASSEEGGRPPDVTTYAVGEEGGRTTQVVGEEGGRPSAVTTNRSGEEGGRTTLNFGEEGGRPPNATTYGIGEEGGRTTLNVGEEGGRPPNATTYNIGEEGGRPPSATTKAIGEEGGTRPLPFKTRAIPAPKKKR